MKPRKELIWLIWKEIFNHFTPPTCLWYTRESGTISSTIHIRNRVSPLSRPKLPKHQFFPYTWQPCQHGLFHLYRFLHRVISRDLPFPNLIVPKPSFPKPIRRGILLREWNSRTFEFFKSMLWKGKRCVWNDDDPTIRRRELKVVSKNIHTTKIFHVSHVVATRYYQMILALCHG